MGLTFIHHSLMVRSNHHHESWMEFKLNNPVFNVASLRIISELSDASISPN